MDSQESSPTPQFKNITSSAFSLLYGPPLTSVHDYWKNHTFVSKVMSLFFNMLSWFVIAFLPRSKCLLILWLQSPSTVILEPKKVKSVTASTFFPSICWSDGTRCSHPMILVFYFNFLMLSLKLVFPLSSSILIKRLFSSSSLSTIRVVPSVYLQLLIVLLAIFLIFIYLAFYFYLFIWVLVDDW